MKQVILSNQDIEVLTYAIQMSNESAFQDEALEVIKRIEAQPEMETDEED